jgi:hypothetical protein
MHPVRYGTGTGTGTVAVRTGFQVIELDRTERRVFESRAIVHHAMGNFRHVPLGLELAFALALALALTWSRKVSA